MENAFLVGVNTGNINEFEVSMKELEKLAIACELVVVGKEIQNLPYPNKAFYVGTGKIGEITAKAGAAGAELLIFDDSLTPSQLRNLQEETKLAVMDRTALILEIFARRAKSHEARLQVEVARLQYMLPRLVGLRDALSRQGGGSGSMSNKGAGEKKLELDRRRIEHRLTELRKELSEVEKERQTQQKKREKSEIPRVAFIGYTNAGKSTLLNDLVEKYLGDESKKVLEKDMLFATLDTAVRCITPKENKSILISDTVGFISKLPHGLVKAFRSTLSEAASANLIVQVVDFSDPDYKEHIRVTKETLKELGASEIPMITAYNKADKAIEEGMLPADTILPRVREGISIDMSARTGQGLTELVDMILKMVYKELRIYQVALPYDRGDLYSYLREYANVLHTEYTAEYILVQAECKSADAGKIRDYIVE